MDGPQELGLREEFNVESIQNSLTGYRTDFDQIAIDPHHYMMLFHTPITIQGNEYELVYKVTRPSNANIITKLSIIDKATFMMLISKINS